MTEKRLKLQVGDVIHSEWFERPTGLRLPKEPKVGSVVAWKSGTIWTRGDEGEWVPTSDLNGAEDIDSPFGWYPDQWEFVVADGEKLTVLRVGK